MFAIFKKLGWFFKLRWKTYSLAVGGLFACAILSAVMPLIIGNTVDQMAAETLTYSSLYAQVGLLLLIGLVMYALRYMWRSNLFTNSTLLEYIMRNRLFDHFTKMDQQFFDRYRTGDLMAHATNDLASLRFVAGGGIITLTDSIAITSVTIFAMFFLIDWKLTILTILPFPLLIILARYLGKLINKYYRGSLESFSTMNDHVQESVAGMSVIKSFGEEDEDYDDFVGTTDNVIEKNNKVYLIDSAYTPVINIITGLTYVLTILFGSYFVSTGRITIGQLVAYFSYLGNMTWPLLAAGRLVNTLERGNVSYDRITKLLANESKVVNAEDPVTDINGKELDVQIHSFAYPDSAYNNLKNINFNLKNGETLGIVGRTGSGKSTLFSLLVRQYDVHDGSILIDGMNIKDIDINEVNNKIGYVAQDNLLFSTTVRDNIRFGNPNMSQEEVEYYAKIADIHEDILDFADGYDTLVGERGVALSGGQKQRISIARTLAIDPDILIMDDALSAVDSKTEQQILKNFNAHRNSGISIIATHRISSIMRSDEILVLEDGEIKERGNHEQLVSEQGWYQNMYNQQQLEQKISEGGLENE